MANKGNDKEAETTKGTAVDTNRLEEDTKEDGEECGAKEMLVAILAKPTDMSGDISP